MTPFYPAILSPMLLTAKQPVTASDNQKTGDSRSSGTIYSNMASDFIDSCMNELGRTYTNATNLDLGKLATCVPKLLFSVVHFLGSLVQGGNDFTGSPLRYLAGGCIKILANTADFGIELTRSGIDLAMLAVKGLGAGLLVMKLDTNVPINVKVRSSEVAAACGAEIELGRLMAVTNWGEDKPGIGGVTGLPPGYAIARIEDIPPSVMAQREGSPCLNGSSLTLRQETRFADGGPHQLMVLKSSGWSALRVGVFKKGDKFILCFQGTEPINRPGTLKTDINILLNVRDSAHDDASKLVKAFADKYGTKNIILVGHSLGGNLATVAGLENYVDVHTINPLGLSWTQRMDLREKIVEKQKNLATATVTNFSSGNDILTKLFQPILPIEPIGIVVMSKGDGAHDSAEAVTDMVETGARMRSAKLIGKESGQEAGQRVNTNDDLPVATPIEESGQEAGQRVNTNDGLPVATQ